MRHNVVPMCINCTIGGPTLHHFLFYNWLWNTPSKTPTCKFFTYWMIKALTNHLQGKINLFGFLQTQLKNQEVFGPPLFPSQEHTPFEGDGPSLVYRHVLIIWDEPSPKERKKAMGFQTSTTSHTKVIRLECNALLGRGMDLNSFTWLMVTYILFQMYTTPTLIQSACSSGDAITWHPNQVHLPIFNTLHFTLMLGGRRYHVIWLKLFLIHLEVHQLLKKQLQPSTNLRSWIMENLIH